jgi:hypothetical protein
VTDVVALADALDREVLHPGADGFDGGLQMYVADMTRPQAESALRVSADGTL